jgi:hypothetical protein
MLAEKPYLRLFKYIFVASVLLLLTAGHCEYSLSTPSEPPEGGIVRRDPNSSSIPHEFPVVLTAVPNPGFVFSHWAHNNSEDPVLEFNMGSSKTTRTAVFIPDPANIVTDGPPPMVSITSPTEGTHFGLTDAIAFRGEATDVEDGSLTEGFLIWPSNLEGQLGVGESFDCTLPSGAHTITLTATDSAAVSSTTTVSITVGDITNRLPDVTIESPENSGTFLTSVDIAFSAIADDPEDGALTGHSLVWVSDVDGEIGTGEAFTATLTEGHHRITLTATDSQDGARSPFIGIDVILPPATATILSPTVGETFLTSEAATSAERPITPTAARWPGQPSHGFLTSMASLEPDHLSTPLFRPWEIT